MKIKPQCVPCLLNRVLFETRLSTDDEQLRAETISNALKVMATEYDPQKSSAEVATKVHRVAYQTLDDDDPYYELKQQSNEVATSLLPHAKQLVEQADDSLKASILCSIIGNILDFGIAGTPTDALSLAETFDEKFQEGLGHDDFSEMQRILENATKVMYFTDNCGEIVFDKIVCKEIKKRYPDIDLSLVVKGKPILTDATKEDAEELSFLTVVDNIFTTGAFAIGVDFSKLPKKVKQSLQQADLIICKGMANYEAFSETEYAPIVYFLRTKCDAVAESMSLPTNINVIKLFL